MGHNTRHDLCCVFYLDILQIVGMVSSDGERGTLGLLAEHNFL